jgi:signal transduction histidine kinase
MNRFSLIGRRYGVDVLIVLAAIAAALEVALRDNPTRAPRTPMWLAVPAVVFVVLPLLSRRRFPFAAPIALWLLAALLSFVDGRLIVYANGVYVAGIAAAFLPGNPRDALPRIGGHRRGPQRSLIYNDPNHACEFIFIPLLFVVAWLAGFALRERAAQAEAAEERATHAEQERESAARIAVAEERARITRELHDIVAHSVSVMVLQVGAVRHNLPQSMAEDREALIRVEQAGRAALQEMRRLLGAMHDDGEDVELAPQPGLDSLDALVKKSAAPALVRHVEGDAFRCRAIDLSAYRIVQEGLTNVLKHAHANQADVTIHYEPDELQVEVRDDGKGGSTSDGLGHGLVGVRERVKIYGGEMTAGTAPQGGFVLSTRLPLSGDRR